MRRRPKRRPLRRRRRIALALCGDGGILSATSPSVCPRGDDGAWGIARRGPAPGREAEGPRAPGGAPAGSPPFSATSTASSKSTGRPSTGRSTRKRWWRVPQGRGSLREARPGLERRRFAGVDASSRLSRDIPGVFLLVIDQFEESGPARWRQLFRFWRNRCQQATDGGDCFRYFRVSRLAKRG